MSTTKLIAYYLPQFHINDVNNAAWGTGFTEWTNVAKARPNFEGHYQPHIPADLGFYDLSFTETLSKQVSLAKEYQIYGFCFYYYWFSGKRVLYKPIENFLKSTIDFHFCICWANENWSKRWDGGNNEIILKQNYEENFEYEFVKSIREILLDKRYIRVNGKPILQIYRPNLFPNPEVSLLKIRESARQLGIGELEIAVVDVWLGVPQAVKIKADAIVEFIPHQYLKEDNFYPYELWDGLHFYNNNFIGCIVDYLKCINQSVSRWLDSEPSIKRYRGIIPSWDNTARKQDDGAIFINSSPELYSKWLSYLIAYSIKYKNDFIFINAWNEWGEGCHLEPDLKYGRSYLEATKCALNSKVTDMDILKNDLVSLVNRQKISNTPKGRESIKPISYKTFIKSRLTQYPYLFKIAKTALSLWRKK